MGKKYLVDFNTGSGNEYTDTLEQAKELAERGLAYTQESVTIYCDDEEVAKLPWWGVQPEEDDVITESFGSYGFYGEWIDL